MNFRKGLVLDYKTVAALLQDRSLLHMLEKYEGQVDFRTPAICLELASQAVENRIQHRGGNLADVSNAQEKLSRLVALIDAEVYEQFEDAARERLPGDEFNHWPIVAAALAYDNAIWSDDEIFLGCGVSTWTTRTVELYMKHI